MTKRHVDSYKPGKRIPSCQLSAYFKYDSAGVKVVPFVYRVKLLGARKPHNMFTFTIIPPPPSSIKHTKRSLTPPLTEGILDKALCTATIYVCMSVYTILNCLLYINVLTHTGSSLKKVRTTEPQPHSGKPSSVVASHSGSSGRRKE